MLDTKSTFDALITRYAADADQAKGILENPLYRSLSASLSGTQEYMAMEKLYELNEEGGFDLIVVDTPPTRNALEFLSAPRRLTRLLENRAFRAVVMPTRVYLRTVGVASQAFAETSIEDRRIGDGQRRRCLLPCLRWYGGRGSQPGEPCAAAVRALDRFRAGRFAQPGCSRRGPVLRRSARRVSRGRRWSDRQPRAAPLRRAGYRIALCGPSPQGVRMPSAGEGPKQALAALVANREEFRAVAEREEMHYGALAAKLAPAPVARVPLLPADVHDLAGLALVADHLFRGWTRQPPSLQRHSASKGDSPRAPGLRQ